MDAPKRLSGHALLSPGEGVSVYRHTLSTEYPLHWHDFYELALVLRGHGCHVLNGIAHPLQPGSLFLISPVDFHALVPAEGQTLELYDVIFSSAWLDAELAGWLFRDPGPKLLDLDPSAQGLFESEFERMWSETHTVRLGRARILRGACERLLIEIARRAPGEPPSAQHPAIRAALVYLQHHFREPVTLAGLAGHVGLAPNYFSELFRRHTGQTFQHYLQQLRLIFAASLLAATPLPVTEVMLASGFGSLAHFERSFKLVHGLAPSAYRECNGSRGA